MEPQSLDQVNQGFNANKRKVPAPNHRQYRNHLSLENPVGESKQYEIETMELVAMGYDHSLAVYALEEHGGDVDLAAAYLLASITSAQRVAQTQDARTPKQPVTATTATTTPRTERRTKMRKSLLNNLDSPNSLDLYTSMSSEDPLFTNLLSDGVDSGLCTQEHLELMKNVQKNTKKDK